MQFFIAPKINFVVIQSPLIDNEINVINLNYFGKLIYSSGFVHCQNFVLSTSSKKVCSIMHCTINFKGISLVLSRA